MRSVLFVFLTTLLVGCLASGSTGAEDSSSTAPLIGVDGSKDQADRSCNVVLRDLGRAGNGTGGYQTSGENWIWQGRIEISATAAGEGLVPSALFQAGSDPTWHEALGLTSTAT